MSLLMKDKKGAVRINDVPGIIIILVSIGIFLAVGAIIVTEIRDNDIVDPNDTNATYAYNVTEDALSGLDTVSSFQTVIAVVVAAAVILGVVFLIRS